MMNYTAMDDCEYLEQLKQDRMWKKLRKDLATATAKIEALEAKLAAAERLINEINDARAANWHLQRRRENDQFEWFSSTADSVFGPFPTALEAFAAVRQENTDA